MRRHGGVADRWARSIKAYGPLLILVTVGPFLLRTIGGWTLLVTPLAMTIPIVWFEWRVRRARRRIASGRLCFGCSYSLVEAATNDDGAGRCPECGAPFEESMYDLDRWKLEVR